MTITRIVVVMNDGDMGDGWNDSDAAAYAYAEFLESRIRDQFPGAEVDVEVRDNTSGHTPPAFVDGDDVRERIDAEKWLENCDDLIWSDFCESPAAATL